MQPSIAPRHALIIGAKQGIGLHLLKKLHAKGWTVHASVRSLTKDAESIAESRLSEIATQTYKIDILNEATIEAAVKNYGNKPLDLLIHCAGVGPKPEDLWDHTGDVLVEKLRVNTVGPFLIAKHFFPALKLSQAGKIINMTSNMGSLTSWKTMDAESGYQVPGNKRHHLSPSIAFTQDEFLQK
ncbi:hypothetical protein VSDG_05490 [Cytospora chrysosperma]|uniref:Ketoreductase (KR) domain-containing protein n=1 Tax=Cytospora chrysosperma TaxID=252740 RepID=A0A423VZF6_CYTCH|nr:hypothetical protein VSDG_05490 [Valsa sordida]